MDETTREWIECFDECKARGEQIQDSVFWRLALHCLPRGVDPDHPRVREIVEEIRQATGSEERL